MDYKTFKNMNDDEYSEYIDGLSKEEVEFLYDSLVLELSEDKEISSKVYWENDYYFTFHKGKVYYMLSYDDCWPKGGVSPDVVTGLSEKDKKAVKVIIDRFGSNKIDDLFKQASEDLMFNYFEHYPEFEDDDMLDYFSEEIEEDEDDFLSQEDEDKEKENEKLLLYKDLIAEVGKYKDCFEKTSDFYDKYRRKELKYGVLYYGYEGMFIELRENLIECGDDPKNNDEILDFLEYFTDLENRIVTAE